MKLAVVGATGEVGRMMLKKLEEESIEPDGIDLFSSSRSAGSLMKFTGKSIEVRELREDSLRRYYDYVLFSAGASISKVFAPIAASYGAVVIDNSSAFRQSEGIPLVVPEINGFLLKDYRGIVANPNC
jgi:aspartate-semialdehyde dehydrogenase